MKLTEVSSTASQHLAANGQLQEACSHLTGRRQGNPSHPTPPAALSCGVATIPWKRPALPMFCLYPTALIQT